MSTILADTTGLFSTTKVAVIAFAGAKVLLALPTSPAFIGAVLLGVTAKRLRSAGLQIEGVVAHAQRHLVRQGWLEVADADFDGTPAPGPVGHEIAADEGVQIEEKRFVGRARGEGFAKDLAIRVAAHIHSPFWEEAKFDRCHWQRPAENERPPTLG